MRSRRRKGRRGDRLAVVLLGVLGLVASPRTARGQAREGLAAAKKGDCVKAVPLLEDAELQKHTPTTASALAGCYVALGELIRASELYRAIAGEKPSRAWTRTDRAEQAAAQGRADAVDARIPTLAFEPDEPYEELEIEIDGHALADPSAPKQVPSDTKLAISARAKGRKPLADKVLLAEGERRVYELRLKKSGPEPPPAAAPPASVGGKPSTTWLGARFRGLMIPRWLMNAFGDGGTTLLAPGGGVTFTTPASDADVVISLGYASYSMGPTPFKPNGTPDTEYEIVESDLQALFATVDLMWSVPLDASGAVTFRIGGGLGVGWTFAGDLHRTQAYPPAGANGDPYLYKKCRGPNDPDGTYRYCNQLDKDAAHYGGFAEPSWFDGGSRPLVFPWVALPQLGLSWRVSPGFALDVEAGLTISGILLGAGWRIGL